MSSNDRPVVEQPRWGNDQWVREHLRAWGLKERLAHEDAVHGHASTANRKLRAAEAAAPGEELPPHIANLMHAVANSEAPLRPEVRAEVEAEIQRRIATHKETSHA